MLGLLLLLVSTWTPPPAPAHFVGDPQHQLSPAAFAKLDARLAGFEQSTGHQLVVYVAASTGEVPLEEFAVKTFEAWKVGRAGLDDGVVLFVFTQDRRARIEVGYGLEGELPDAIASRLLRERLVPALAEGRLEQGLTDTVAGIIGTLDGALVPPAPAVTQPQLPPPWVWVLGALALLAFVVLAVTHPRAAWNLLTFVFFLLSRSGGRGGGGFHGRGGRSGGGGASTGW